MGWLKVMFRWQQVSVDVNVCLREKIQKMLCSQPFWSMLPNLTVMSSLQVNLEQKAACLLWELLTMFTVSLPKNIAQWSLLDDFRGDVSIKASTSVPSPNINIDISIVNMQTRLDLWVHHHLGFGLAHQRRRRHGLLTETVIWARSLGRLQSVTRWGTVNKKAFTTEPTGWRACDR